MTFFSTLKLTVLTIAIMFISSTALASSPSSNSPRPRLIVEDGQLQSHRFTVFAANADINSSMMPELLLRGAQQHEEEPEVFAPALVVPGQTRSVELDGSRHMLEGTVMTFDLRRFPIPWYRPSARLLVALRWKTPSLGGPDEGTESIVADKEVYLGKMLGALVWTGAVVGLVVFLLYRWSVHKSKEIRSFSPRAGLLLLTGPDGYLSLWRTQLALWTVAVGSIVFWFGLLRLHVPAVPETLVTLMGMSLLTGTISAKKANDRFREAMANIASRQPSGEHRTESSQRSATEIDHSVASPLLHVNGGFPSWSDLISTWNPNKNELELSLPKAQMVLWTSIVLTLFVVKSLLAGELWLVPWELVALTGFSQAGYVGAKYVTGSA